jgi:hypothetical protein
LSVHTISLFLYRAKDGPNIQPIIHSDGTSQQTSSLSRATLGLSFSSPRASKIKLFNPDNSKNQAFQAWPKKTLFSVFYSKDTL